MNMANSWVLKNQTENVEWLLTCSDNFCPSRWACITASLTSRWKFRSTCSMSYVPCMASDSSSNDRMYACQCGLSSAMCAKQPLITLRQYPIQGLLSIRPWQWGQYCILRRALPHSLETCRWSVVLMTSMPRFSACSNVRLGNSDLPICPITLLGILPNGLMSRRAIRMHSEYSKELSVTPGLVR